MIFREKLLMGIKLYESVKLLLTKNLKRVQLKSNNKVITLLHSTPLSALARRRRLCRALVSLVMRRKARSFARGGRGGRTSSVVLVVLLAVTSPEGAAPPFLVSLQSCVHLAVIMCGFTPSCACCITLSECGWALSSDRLSREGQLDPPPSLPHQSDFPG